MRKLKGSSEKRNNCFCVAAVPKPRPRNQALAFFSSETPRAAGILETLGFFTDHTTYQQLSGTISTAAESPSVSAQINQGDHCQQTAAHLSVLLPNGAVQAISRVGSGDGPHLQSTRSIAHVTQVLVITPIDCVQLHEPALTLGRLY
ncbi:hypothetical protein MHYP_G00078000 [Metynnis hypsauchen]